MLSGFSESQGGNIPASQVHRGVTRPSMDELRVFFAPGDVLIGTFALAAGKTEKPDLQR